MSSESDEYEVEAIMDTRITLEGKVEYLVKWKGWPLHSMTFEPEENLFCVGKLREFHAVWSCTHEEVDDVRQLPASKPRAKRKKRSRS